MMMSALISPTEVRYALNNSDPGYPTFGEVITRKLHMIRTNLEALHLIHFFLTLTNDGLSDVGFVIDVLNEQPESPEYGIDQVRIF